MPASNQVSRERLKLIHLPSISIPCLSRSYLTSYSFSIKLLVASNSANRDTFILTTPPPFISIFHPTELCPKALFLLDLSLLLFLSPIPSKSSSTNDFWGVRIYGKINQADHQKLDAKPPSLQILSPIFSDPCKPLSYQPTSRAFLLPTLSDPFSSI